MSSNNETLVARLDVNNFETTPRPSIPKELLLRVQHILHSSNNPQFSVAMFPYIILCSGSGIACIHTCIVPSSSYTFLKKLAPKDLAAWSPNTISLEKHHLRQIQPRITQWVKNFTYYHSNMYFIYRCNFFIMITIILKYDCNVIKIKIKELLAKGMGPLLFRHVFGEDLPVQTLF